MSPFGKTNHSLTALMRRSTPNDIARILQAAKQLVHCLFTDARALGENAWTYPVRARELEHGNMRQPQLIEAGGVEPLNDSAMDGLSRNAE